MTRVSLGIKTGKLLRPMIGCLQIYKRNRFAQPDGAAWSQGEPLDFGS